MAPPAGSARYYPKRHSATSLCNAQGRQAAGGRKPNPFGIIFGGNRRTARGGRGRRIRLRGERGERREGRSGPWRPGEAVALPILLGVLPLYATNG